MTLRTDRLVLRPWRRADLAPFAAMNRDPEVMRYLPSVLSRAESDRLAQAIRAHFDRHGFGLWAVEVPGAAPFIGFVGLSIPTFKAHFTPCVEVGWRLARAHWGRGYATEGGHAALRFGFETLGLEEVLSFTTATNQRSRRVMARLGMRHAPGGDFYHPSLPPRHPLRRHVLYRLTRARWEQERSLGSTGIAHRRGNSVG